MRAILIGVLGAVLLAPRPVLAQGDSLSGLKGLTGVLVIVDEFDPRTGLTPAALSSEVEQVLQKAGIRALTRDQFQNAVGRPALYIAINAIQPPIPEAQDLMLFDVRVAIYQGVSLQRAPTVRMAASTWDADQLGFSGQPGAKDIIRDGLRSLLNRFIAAVHEANLAVAGGAPTLPAPAAPPSATAKVPVAPQPASDTKRLVAAAKTIAVRQTGGPQELKSAIEHALELWGGLQLVNDPLQADLMLEVTGSEAKVSAVLLSRTGARLWDTTKGEDTSDDVAIIRDVAASDASHDFSKLGEGVVDALKSFIGDQ